MADAQIVRSESVENQATYTVQGDSRVTLKAVRCFYDDAGISLEWMPEVQIISDSGHVIARAADQGVRVTPGNFADVTWFPGVKSAGSSTTGTLPFLILQGILTSVANPPVGDADHGKFDASTKFTNAASEWAYTLDGSGRIKEVLINGPGLYDVTLNYRWEAPAAASKLDALININSAVGETFNGVTMFGVSPNDSLTTTALHLGTVRGVFPITRANSIINVQPVNGGAAAVNFTPVYLTIIKHPLSPAS